MSSNGAGLSFDTLAHSIFASSQTFDAGNPVLGLQPSSTSTYLDAFVVNASVFRLFGAGLRPDAFESRYGRYARMLGQTNIARKRKMEDVIRPALSSPKPHRSQFGAEVETGNDMDMLLEPLEANDNWMQELPSSAIDPYLLTAVDHVHDPSDDTGLETMDLTHVAEQTEEPKRIGSQSRACRKIDHDYSDGEENQPPEKLASPTRRATNHDHDPSAVKETSRARRRVVLDESDAEDNQVPQKSVPSTRQNTSHDEDPVFMMSKPNRGRKKYGKKRRS